MIASIFATNDWVGVGARALKVFTICILLESELDQFYLKFVHTVATANESLQTPASVIAVRDSRVRVLKSNLSMQMSEKKEAFL